MSQAKIFRNRDYPSVDDDGLYRIVKDPESGFLASLFEDREHTCEFCGYHSPSFLEGEPVDGEYENEYPENWLVLCHYCRATQHVGAALKAGAYWGGVKAYSQEAINRICRAMPWIIKNDLSPNLEAFFGQSAKIIETYMGSKGAVDMLPTHLKVLLKAREDSYESAVELLTRNGLRMIFPKEYRPQGIDALRAYDEARARGFIQQGV